MFLEDPQIDLPYSCHAITRSWLVHGFADQGARLYVGDTLASPSTLFQIDHHADHTHPESGARVGNLAHCAFSSAISGNARIFGGNPLIWNYQLLWVAGEDLRAVYDHVLLAEYACHYDLRTGKVTRLRLGQWYPSPFAARRAQGTLLERTPQDAVIVLRPPAVRRLAASPLRAEQVGLLAAPQSA